MVFWLESICILMYFDASFAYKVILKENNNQLA